MLLLLTKIAQAMPLTMLPQLLSLLCWLDWIRLTNDTVLTSAWKMENCAVQCRSNYKWILIDWFAEVATPHSVSASCLDWLQESRTILKQSQQLNHISCYLCLDQQAWLLLLLPPTIYNLPHGNVANHSPLHTSVLQAGSTKTFTVFRYVLRAFINLEATQHAFDLCLIRSSNKLITIID